MNKDTKQSADNTENIRQLHAKIDAVRKAQALYSAYSQESVDEIFKAAALAANRMRIPLAKMAVSGGYGHTASIYIDAVAEKQKLYRFCDTMKTCRIVVNAPSAHGGVLQTPPP